MRLRFDQKKHFPNNKCLNINNFSKMYFQCQQYLLGVTFSKNSSNIFLVCTEGLCLCIYGGMDCLPLPYYVSYRDKTDVGPRPYTRYILLFEVMHQTRRGLKRSQVQTSGDSLRLWKRKRHFYNSEKPLLCVNDLIDGPQKFWTKLSRSQNNNRNTQQQHASERQLQNVTPSLCTGHQLNV